MRTTARPIESDGAVAPPTIAAAGQHDSNKQMSARPTARISLRGTHKVNHRHSGRAKRGPESITPTGGYGFRARRVAAPRNDRRRDHARDPSCRPCGRADYAE